MWGEERQLVRGCGGRGTNRELASLACFSVAWYFWSMILALMRIRASWSMCLWLNEDGVPRVSCQ